MSKRATLRAYVGPPGAGRRDPKGISNSPQADRLRAVRRVVINRDGSVQRARGEGDKGRGDPAVASECQAAAARRRFPKIRSVRAAQRNARDAHVLGPPPPATLSIPAGVSVAAFAQLLGFPEAAQEAFQTVSGI